MRTTVRLDDDLLREAKKLALDTERTLTNLIEDGLRTLLSRRKKETRRSRVHLKTVRGQGVHRGIDLDDTASLIEVMEQDHDDT